MGMTNSKPILCLDFDGVLHSYASGWKGADVIPDPPVPGAMDFIMRASNRFRIVIHSSRSSQPGGEKAMKHWLWHCMMHELDGLFEKTLIEAIYSDIEWSLTKPPAFVTIDDRSITFDGTFPVIGDLLKFKPWFKRENGTAEKQKVLSKALDHVRKIQ